MITLQTQNYAFGHGGHHHDQRTSKPSKYNHPEIGKYAKPISIVGGVSLAILTATLIVKGPKCERIAKEQVQATLGCTAPDSTLHRLVKEQVEKNRKSADSAKALIKRLGFDD